MPSLKFLAVLLIFICALSSASADCSDCCLYNRCSAAYGGGSGVCCDSVSINCCSSLRTCGIYGTCTADYVGMTIGAIIAIIVGSIVGCILLCVLFVWLITRQRRTTTIITQGTPVYAT